MVIKTADMKFEGNRTMAKNVVSVEARDRELELNSVIHF